MYERALTQTPGGIMNDFTNRVPSADLKGQPFMSTGKEMRSTSVATGHNKNFIGQSQEKGSTFDLQRELERSVSLDQNLNP